MARIETARVVIACYACGKRIRGEYVATCPSLLQEQLGDFPKSFHVRCYELSEREAERELRGAQ